MSPGLELDRRLRAEPRLLAAADRARTRRRCPARPPKAPAGPAQRAVGEHGERRRPVEEEVLAQPEPAAEAARPVGVLDEREPRDAHRVVELGLLDRRVLGVLAVRLHGVGPVARERGRRSRRRTSRGSSSTRSSPGRRRRSRRGTSSPSSPRAAARAARAGARGRSRRRAASASPSRRRPGSARCSSSPCPRGASSVIEPVEAVVDRQVGVDQALERVGARRERLRVGRVDRRAALRVGAGEVEARRRRRRSRRAPAAAPARRCSRRCRRSPRPRRRRAAAPRARRACGARCSRAARASSATIVSRPCRVDERLQPPHAGHVRGDLRAEVARRSRAWSGSARGSARRRRRTIRPASTTLTGGMITPSWNTSRNAPIDAGAPPPTSTWCARFAT